MKRPDKPWKCTECGASPRDHNIRDAEVKGAKKPRTGQHPFKA